MFAALMVVRMREAFFSSSSPAAASWVSPDAVPPLELPLARAAEKVLASMHEVLGKTCAAMEAEVGRGVEQVDGPGMELDEGKRLHLLRSRAAELRLVRNLGSLRSPAVEFRAMEM